MRDEVMKAIKSQKRGKASGVDGISNDFLMRTSQVVIYTITDLLNEILTSEYIQHQWTTSTIILLNKKGKLNDISNHIPISLMSNVFKYSLRYLILEGLTRTLDENQPEEQAGFRSGFSTIDHIHNNNNN